MVKPKNKKLSYFTLCSNEFVLFLVALGVGWEEIEEKKTVKDREAWCVIVHGVVKSWTPLSN